MNKQSAFINKESHEKIVNENEEEKHKELRRKRKCERQRAYYHRQKDLKKNEEKKKKVPKTNAERQREFRQRKAKKSYVDMKRRKLCSNEENVVHCRDVENIENVTLQENQFHSQQLYIYEQRNECITPEVILHRNTGIPSDENAPEVPGDLSMYDEDDTPTLSRDSQSKGEEESLFNEYHCNVCNKTITEFRYTCVQCSDLDLCGACEAARAHHHHYVLRVPADRHVKETEAVLATIRLHLMKDLDPIAELEPDPGKSVKLEIKAESEEEVNITLEQEFNVATPDLFVPDTKFIVESMVLPIEKNEIDDPQVPLNVSTIKSEMTSEIEPTEKATGTERKICATNMQQNTKKEYLKPHIYKRKTLRTLITEDQISKAKTLIQEGNTKRRAAELVGISEAALRKRLKSDHVPTSLGRFKPTFTEEQEEEFATQCSGIDTNVFSAESPRAATFKIQLPPPPRTTGSEQVQKICNPSDLSNNTRVYSYNTYRVAPDCTVRVSTLPDAALHVQRTSTRAPSNKSNSAAEDKR